MDFADPLLVEKALQRPFDLKTRRILVVGAGGGIGAATAAICHEMGAIMFLTDRVAPSLVRERVALGQAVPIFQTDTSERAAVEALAAQIGPIDAVIDASGISPLDDWMADDWDEAFDAVIGANLRGPINLARAFMPGMMERGWGRFALTGSVSGRMGGIKCGPHYAAAKGGLHALTRWLAQRGVSRNVLVNAVAPGSIATPMAASMKIDPKIYPQGRAGRPREIGGTLAFLCTPAAGFMTGAVLDVNGGTYFG